jgi:2-polyprenyl-3-methyl-5-hydroxy-6-metoxy-1,4-benzoquinol methylase
MNIKKLTWEESVLWLRNQSDQQELVRAAFYDDPLIDAAERYFKSTEWAALRSFFPRVKGKVLDIGAGRGIASFAFAKEGWDVTALEPDSSAIVGANAITRLANEACLSIEVVQEWGESLPFENASFHVVHCRSVLHHARDLKRLCSEINRVLLPGGTMVATREHVIDCKKDLSVFLKLHPLHHLYGGENAFLIKEYLQAIKASGLKLKHVLSPLASDINVYPNTLKSIKEKIALRLGIPVWLISNTALRLLGEVRRSPGKNYSFVATKAEIA